MRRLIKFFFLAVTFLACTQESDKYSLKDIEQNQKEYDFYLIYKGVRFPDEKLEKYFSLEKLPYSVTCKTYNEEGNFILELPSKLDFYLAFGLVADISEARSGQINPILIAKNKKDNDLSFYLLYQDFNQDNTYENYTGYLVNGQIFQTNITGIMGDSLAKNSKILNEQTNGNSIESYLKSKDFNVVFFKEFSKHTPSITTIPKNE